MAAERRWPAAAVAVTASVLLACPAAPGAAEVGTAATVAATSPALVAATPVRLTPVALADPLSSETGLTVTIERLSPGALEPGKSLRIRGRVTNVGDLRWRDAQVYLDIASDPVTTKGGLEEITSSDEPFGTRIIKLGLFDEIGAVPPGTTKTYRLEIPYKSTPLSGAPGVYRVGVSVLATDRDGVREVDARADTVMPLVTDPDLDAAPTPLVTVVPVTAPIKRHASGNFLDDRLADSISSGGRLRNVVDFLNAVPPDTIEMVADPALLDAVEDMSKGYLVTTRAEEVEPGAGRDGSGQSAAADWLADFQAAASRQSLLLMAWGAPDAIALSRAWMPGIVEAAVRASEDYATDRGLIAPTVSWQKDGASTRRALVIARSARATIQFVADKTLVDLRPAGDSAYLPSMVRVPTPAGQLTAAVAAGELAGQRLTAATGLLDFRQHLMAEATIRFLEAPAAPSPALVALPFDWDPGDEADAVSLAGAYGLQVVDPVGLEAVTQTTPTPYLGPIRPADGQPRLGAELTRAIERLRTTGETLSDLLTAKDEDVAAFEQRLAESASSLWLSQPQERLALTRMESRRVVEELSKVTVTGPTFVALSSRSGSFPLTITNGLKQQVTLSVHVQPRNPALRIDPIEDLVLAPGQSRDIEVTTRSNGSGLTPVRVRLQTVNHRVFGAPWEFDIRATQIGLAIWVVTGVGGAVLIGTAALRLVRRFRTQGFHPRQKPSP